MPIIEEECKHCIPVWKLTKLMAEDIKLERFRPQFESGFDPITGEIVGGMSRESWKVGVELRWTACLEDLRCAPHRRGWEDPPNLVPPARPRPTIYPRLVIPPFRAHPRFPAAGAIAIGPPIYAGPGAEDVDIVDGFLGGQGPITFEGQIDETQDKVCCKPDVGFPTTASPPSQLQSCCSKKREIICGCYVQGGRGRSKTTVDECCIQGRELDVLTYWTDLHPLTQSQHNILNSTQILWSSRERKPPKQIILDRMNKIFKEIGGRGVGWSNCLGANVDNGYRFDPPEQEAWKATCPCRVVDLGQAGVEEKCP